MVTAIKFSAKLLNSRQLLLCSGLAGPVGPGSSYDESHQKTNQCETLELDDCQRRWVKLR
jgi:hypothetical protein